MVHRQGCMFIISYKVYVHGNVCVSMSVCPCLTHQVGLAGCMVLLGTHAHQAVIVEENAKWITGSDKDVDAQIKLVAFHQEGFVQVLLNDKVLLGWQLLTITDKRDPG